jgi:hypothetical protein
MAGTNKGTPNLMPQEQMTVPLTAANSPEELSSTRVLKLPFN